MILCDFQIKAEIERGTLKISPFDESLINPSSLDVRLGHYFGVPKPTYVAIDPLDPTSFRTDMEEAGFYMLPAKSFVIGCLLEKVEYPLDITGHLKGKSSLGRLGIENSSCAGHLDPQFAGHVTIELFNYLDCPVKLTAGMKIGQLVFFKHVPAEHGYGDRQTSKYQNQQAGQPSKGVN